MVESIGEIDASVDREWTRLVMASVVDSTWSTTGDSDTLVTWKREHGPQREACQGPAGMAVAGLNGRSEASGALYPTVQPVQVSESAR